MTICRGSIYLGAVLVFFGVTSIRADAADLPNIVVIWGDDIGYWNVSYNNDGMMGYQTPNIDRITSRDTRPQLR